MQIFAYCPPLVFGRIMWTALAEGCGIMADAHRSAQQRRFPDAVPQWVEPPETATLIRFPVEFARSRRVSAACGAEIHVMPR